MGTRILAGRYELLEKIGDGGMAVVYKAKCRLLNRYVAVKILKPEFTKDAKFIENFRRESQAAASLSHPNIVNVYDVGREGNINYIVMELIEGEVLSDVIKKRAPLAPREAVSIARQIASALSHAHKNHIIHRDVKPHNILLTPDGTAKITDFGIAKAVNAGTIVGKTGTVMGSVHYFSPEQARGGYVDEKSDIYSLGIVLYEMLTGQVPFDAENPVAVAVMHMNNEMIPPSQLVSGVPPEVEDIVMKAASKYQINRFKSADEMLEALQKASLSTIGIYSGMDYRDKKNLDATIVMQAVNGNRQMGGGYQDEAGSYPYPEDQGMGMTPPPGEEGGPDMGKNKKEKKKMKFNKIKVLAVVLALACAFPVSQLILYLLEGGFSGDKEVKVPSLIGKTVEQAEEELKDLDLELAVDREVYSTEYDEGEIVSQDPLEDMKVKTGKTIKVNVSKGIKSGVVPDVKGKTLSSAIEELASYGYEKGRVTEEESSMPEGVVIRQSPEGGSEAEEGEEVDLVLSKGKEVETTTVPPVVSLNVDRAKEEIQKAGLTISADGITYEYNSATVNTVISQSPSGGTSAEKNSSVSIVVSKGPEKPEGPTSVTLTIDYSEAPDEVFYLTVLVSDSAGVGTPINYEQRLKSNGSESLTVTGTGQGTVTILFNNTQVKAYTVDFDTGTYS